MPKNPNDRLWRFPDHKEWIINVRVNSQSKKYLIRDIKEVLTSCGMLLRFREGPFGQYLDLPQPLKIHGKLIHNLLKREIIIPGQRDDEIWLGLGRSKVRFGKEEFCICSGLKMGMLPQGFNEKKDVEKGSLLKRYFKEKRPNAELVYATMKNLTSEEGEDILKMSYIFMVSQFFGTDDGRKAIPGWMFALVEDEEAFKKFPWGSYIYSITLFWLKSLTEKHLSTLKGKKEEKKEEEEEEEEEKKKKAVVKGKRENKGKDGEEENEEEEDQEENKELEGQQRDENKEGGQLGEIQVDVKQDKKKSKYHTINIFGFSLAFQVWAVERITRLTLTDAIRRRIGTGFPRFNRWDFNTKVVNIESKFISMMSLFPWVVHTYEKGLDYYKSLKQYYVCGPLTHKGKDLVKAVQSLTKEEEKEEKVGSDEEHDKNFKLDGGDESIYNHYTSASLGRSPDDPPSRKKLFDDTNFQTHKSTFQTSIQPSTIADLYSAIGLLIKESEERQLSFCREEFAKIREQIKVGDTPAKKSTEEKSGTSKQKYDKFYKEDRDGLTFLCDQLEKYHVDLHVETLGKEKSDAQADSVANSAMEESDAQVDTAVNDVGVLPKSDAQAEAEANSNMEDSDAQVDAAVKGDGVLPKSDAQADSVANSDGVPPKSDSHEHGDPLADSKMVEDVDNQTILDENEMKEINDCVQLCIEEKLVQKVEPLKKISNVHVKSVQRSIDVDDYPSPTLSVVVPNPSPSVVAYDVPHPNVIYKDYDLKRARKRSSLYTGQIKFMERKEFKELVNPRKLISDMHIHSYFDILWRRRSTKDVNYLQNIALDNTSFFMNLKRRWDIQMEEMEALREIQEFERNHHEGGNEGKDEETRKKESKTKGNKKKDPPPVVTVWEEYLEFNPIEFEPDTDWLEHVSGHELLYTDPWWKMDSVLIPCNTGNHWVLCHVILNIGEVHLYDSLWPRNGYSDRLKDIRCILYLLPSILKHSGYYAETKSDPHTSPLIATNIKPTLIPQQNDGYSCGVFMMKYAELILSGVKLPWLKQFSQKDIPAIRKAMAVDIFTNGQIANE
ncbi:hypothetical protein Dsin_005505 [Dipteronia sinensis]|uniref:Ubiquitin-like protease family profile domain-containing protein n=1 Tax=Dipteronia sinensis TaxID=43782 RepID=A0AAE0AWN6_9ROSI|nr:hypothetical protein Dsin_005505 [Dipteronia sinensis]